jgi:[acyl-carrier-protein] S-malonyltransferase
MDEVSPHPAGLMAVRGLARQEVNALCRATGVEVAIINSPDHFILGGPEEALRDCESSPFTARATTLKRLQVTVPSHTSWLSEASRTFGGELTTSSLHAPDPPVLAGVSGAVVRTREDAILALARQISQPINWLACLQTAIEMGVGVFLELGPGNALSKMLQEIAPDAKVRSTEDFRSLQGIAAWAMKHFS